MPNKDKIINTPARFSGKWIAWDAKHTTVIASGNTMKETKEKAKKKTDKYWLDKIPSEEGFFIGESALQ